MNKNMLVSKMKLYGDTQGDLANAIGKSVTRTNAKINSLDGALFDLNEVRLIMIKYNLTSDEVVQIFLTENDTIKGIR